MTWEEHEKEYCFDIKPIEEDIIPCTQHRKDFPSYCEAENYIDFLTSDEYGAHFSYETVRWEGKYYVVSLTSNESEAYYRHELPRNT